MTFTQPFLDGGIVFFEQREKHVLRAHVVVVVVAAFLLGGPKNAARRGAELCEQRTEPTSLEKKSGRGGRI